MMSERRARSLTCRWRDQLQRNREIHLRTCMRKALHQDHTITRSTMVEWRLVNAACALKSAFERSPGADESCSTLPKSMIKSSYFLMLKNFGKHHLFLATTFAITYS